MKIGRNAPCPCGSGKKYKKCCLPLDKANRSSAGGASANHSSAGGASIRQIAARAAEWQADLLPFPTLLGDDPKARPAAVMVTADGFVIANEILTCPSVEIDGIAQELDRAVNDAIEKIGAPPFELVVREEEVASVLAARMRQRGLAIAVRAGSLEGVETAMAAFNQETIGKNTAKAPSMPATWAAWGQPTEWIADVFRASAAFYRAGPWRHVDDFPPIAATMPDGNCWWLSILGSAGIEYGVAFYSHPDDLDLTIDSNLLDPKGRVLALNFGDTKHLYPPMRREIARANWEIASDNAYPALLTVGTPAGGLRKNDALDLVAILTATADWTLTIDSDRSVLDKPWRDPSTGVELECEGFEINEHDSLPPLMLATGGAEGPGSDPHGALARAPLDERDEQPVDDDRMKSFKTHLESQRLSAATVRAHTENVEYFLDYLANWVAVPLPALHEYYLRTFLFDWYPRKAASGRTAASKLLASLRRFFDFLAAQEEIFCPWADDILKDKATFLARWDASPVGPFWDEEVIDWRYDHFEELDRRVLSPSQVVHGVLTWGRTQGRVEASLWKELQRHWLCWRDQLIRSGLEWSDELRAKLQQREAEWLTTPHSRYQGRTPREAIEAEREKMARHLEGDSPPPTSTN